MFCSLNKRLVSNLNFRIYVGYSNTHLDFVQYNHCIFFKYFSSSSVLSKKKPKLENDEQHSFTVSYLVNSCGLSSENAISASKKVQFESPKRPDSVLTLLKNHGFTDTHISKLVRKLPVLLLASPKDSLLPKFDFFHSIGVPSYEIVRILSSDPTLFRRSLENQFIPCYNYLKNLVGTDEKLVKAFKRSSIIFRENLSTNFTPNMEVLRELGVTQSSIMLLVTQHPDAAFFTHKRFNETVEYLKVMGFDPKKLMFVQAIKVITSIGKATLEHKFEIYSRWGWSKDEALSAFKCHPHCMGLSEEKIKRVMDFLVNKMGWPSKVFARRPIILCLSLEKRIIPRCSVIQALLSKGLIKKRLSIYTILQPTGTYFLHRFVTRFQENVPELVDLYEGKIDLLDSGIKLQEKCEMSNL